MLGNVLASCCWVCCRNTEDTISLKVSKALKVSTWGKILQHPGDKRKPHWTFLILWYILYQSLSGWASPICSLDMCQALDVYNILVITDSDTFVTLEIRKKGKKLIRVTDKLWLSHYFCREWKKMESWKQKTPLQCSWLKLTHKNTCIDHSFPNMFTPLKVRIFRI